MTTPRAALTSMLAVLAPALACAAPAARPARGPAADAVRQGIAEGTRGFDHAAWDGLLRRFVDGGRVDYEGLRSERAKLAGYLSALAAAELRTLSRAELLALLINAYNACTVALILDAPSGLPRSIRDLDDPWGRPRCALGGEKLSLDTIEHGLIRALFKDSRIHAAVNCASKSCPPLQPWAFRGDRSDAQLDEAMRGMVGSDAHVRVEGGRLRVSSIFDWYKGDFLDPSFTPRAASVAEYVKAFAAPELRARIEGLGARPRVESLPYDWSLNAGRR